MKIKSNLLRAAMLVQAKNDVRRYLCGLHINRKYVQATNGHVAVQMEHSAKIRNPITIIILGKIPAKAELTKFAFGKDGKRGGMAKHYDALGFMIAIHPIEVVTGNFPDFTNKNIFGDIDRFDFKNPMPAINPEYMTLPSKMFKEQRHMAMRPAPSKEGGPVLMHFSGLTKEVYGNPQFIVMPMRW